MKTLKLLLNVYSYTKLFLKPEYISLFHQPLKSSLSACFMDLGVAKYSMYSIKFFSGTKHETIFRSENKKEVVRLGTFLASFFDVELYNTLQ